MTRCIKSLVLIWGLLGWWIVGGLAFDCAPASKSLTIKTIQDVSDLSTCPTFTGNILVAADGPTSITLDGLTTLVGNLDVENVDALQTLSSTTLTTLTTFTLNKLPQLTNLSFPALKSFTSLKWDNLPLLEDVEVATAGTMEGEIQSISIVNTSLKNLDWVKWPVGATLNISSNGNLESFSLAYNTINSGSAVCVAGNPSLSKLDVSALNGIYGGLEIAGNPKMIDMDFGTLESIGGYVKMSGAFKNISMPGLNSINGALSVESTEDISPLCNDLQDKKLTGHYDCTPNAQKSITEQNPSGTATGSPTTTGSPNTVYVNDGEEADLSTPAKAALAVAALFITTLILIFAFFYFRRRSRAKVREIDQKPKVSEVDSVELAVTPTSRTSFPKAELETKETVKEIADGRDRLEMPAVVPTELDGGYDRSELRTPVSPAPSWRSGVSARSDTPLVRHELPA